MAVSKRTGRKSNARRKLENSVGILKALGFGPRQTNDTAGYALLALANLSPTQAWSAAESPLRGITPIIEFIGQSYKVVMANFKCNKIKNCSW
jgi:hypothetical protein